MTDLRTSVIVRCFNEERHIGRLLSGLVRQTRQPDQIVIVDSGSTDATLAIARRFPVEIHTIEPEQFSFGRSLNIGCRAADGDILVFASAHVHPVYDTWLVELTAPFSDPQVALTYGRQEGTSGPSTPSSGSWRAGFRHVGRASGSSLLQQRQRRGAAIRVGDPTV